MGVLVALTMCCTTPLANPLVARADDVVTYEIVSNDIRSVNVEYVDFDRRVFIPGVVLPWRADLPVSALDGAQVRADWRPGAWPSKWVTVRIIHRGEVLCQSTLDIGNATCYGNTPHFA